MLIHMADKLHLDILARGVEAWNSWMKQSNFEVVPDFSGADLSRVDLFRGNLYVANLFGTNLSRANLSQAHLAEANLSQANLYGANIRGADLSKTNVSYANLYGADLRGADLRNADCSHANLSRANLSGANFREATLSRADLTQSSLVRTNLKGTILTDCRVYGISTWDLKLSEQTQQQNLVISPSDEASITVDDIEVAQFVYLILNNEKLRYVIDTMTSKAVVILGRFTSERKPVLNAIRDKLRDIGYLPIMFDFEGPSSRDLIETVATLASLARFIIADITDAKAVDQELQAILPQIKVPVRPLLLEGAAPPGEVFQVLWRKHRDQLLKIHRYRDQEGLLASFRETVIDPAEARVKQLKMRELEDIFD